MAPRQVMYAIATGHAVMRDYGAAGQSIAVDARGVRPLVPRHIAYGFFRNRK